MVEAVVTTGVDALLDFLKTTDKVAMVDAAKKLGVPLSTMQSWVDFLVEERIVGIEYKFTKPFIYLNKEKKSDSVRVKKDLPSLGVLKKEYFERARAKKIPEEQIDELWLAHIRQELSYLEHYFNEQANERGVHTATEQKELWSAYVEKFMVSLGEAD